MGNKECIVDTGFKCCSRDTVLQKKNCLSVHGFAVHTKAAALQKVINQIGSAL